MFTQYSPVMSGAGCQNSVPVRYQQKSLGTKQDEGAIPTVSPPSAGGLILDHPVPPLISRLSVTAVFRATILPANSQLTVCPLNTRYTAAANTQHHPVVISVECVMLTVSVCHPDHSSVSHTADRCSAQHTRRETSVSSTNRVKVQRK